MIDKNQVVAVRSKSAGGRIIGTDVNREPHLYESLYPEGYVSTLLGQLEDERAAREQWQKNCRRVEKLAEAAEERAEALAVENQSLKSAITGKAYIDFVTSNGWNPGMKTINGKFAGFIDAEIDFGCMAYDHAKKLIDAVETPATSAALAAIEARGVEKYADHLASSESPFAGLGSARNFAKQLREAK